MTADPHNPVPSGSDWQSGEQTLRLIANLSAPEGLEDRLHAALHAAPQQISHRLSNLAGANRRGRVLAWPASVRPKIDPQSSWMRTAAAAAIVFVVAGGGWGVYTRVQHNQPNNVIVMPPRVSPASGFSSAGAIRTPQTLPGPVVIQSVRPHSGQPKPAKKSAAKPASKAAASTEPATAAVPAPLQPIPSQ